MRSFAVAALLLSLALANAQPRLHVLGPHRGPVSDRGPRPTRPTIADTPTEITATTEPEQDQDGPDVVTEVDVTTPAEEDTTDGDSVPANTDDASGEGEEEKDEEFDPKRMCMAPQRKRGKQLKKFANKNKKVFKTVQKLQKKLGGGGKTAKVGKKLKQLFGRRAGARQQQQQQQWPRSRQGRAAGQRPLGALLQMHRGGRPAAGSKRPGQHAGGRPQEGGRPKQEVSHFGKLSHDLAGECENVTCDDLPVDCENPIHFASDCCPICADEEDDAETSPCDDVECVGDEVCSVKDNTAVCCTEMPHHPLELMALNEKKESLHKNKMTMMQANRGQQQRWSRPQMQRGSQRGFQSQKRGFSQQQRGFGQQQRGYGYQQRGFGQQQRGFGQQQRGFGQQQRGFGQQQRGFGQQQRGFGQQQRGFGQQQRGYGYQQRGFGQQRRGFGQQQRGFGQQQRGFGQQQRGFGGRQTFGGYGNRMHFANQKMQQFQRLRQTVFNLRDQFAGLRQAFRGMRSHGRQADSDDEPRRQHRPEDSNDEEEQQQRRRPKRQVMEPTEEPLPATEEPTMEVGTEATEPRHPSPFGGMRRPGMTRPDGQGRPRRPGMQSDDRRPGPGQKQDRPRRPGQHGGFRRPGKQGEGRRPVPGTRHAQATKAKGHHVMRLLKHLGFNQDACTATTCPQGERCFAFKGKTACCAGRQHRAGGAGPDAHQGRPQQRPNRPGLPDVAQKRPRPQGGRPGRRDLATATGRPEVPPMAEQPTAEMTTEEQNVEVEEDEVMVLGYCRLPESPVYKSAFKERGCHCQVLAHCVTGLQKEEVDEDKEINEEPVDDEVDPDTEEEEQQQQEEEEEEATGEEEFAPTEPDMEELGPVDDKPDFDLNGDGDDFEKSPLDGPGDMFQAYPEESDTATARGSVFQRQPMNDGEEEQEEEEDETQMGGRRGNYAQRRMSQHGRFQAGMAQRRPIGRMMMRRHGYNRQMSPRFGGFRGNRMQQQQQQRKKPFGAASKQSQQHDKLAFLKRRGAMKIVMKNQCFCPADTVGKEARQEKRRARLARRVKVLFRKHQCHMVA